MRISIDLRSSLSFRLSCDDPMFTLYAQDGPEETYPPILWSFTIWTDSRDDPEPFCQALEELVAQLRSSHQKQKQEPSPLPPPPNSDTLSVKSSDGDYDAVQVSEASPDDEGSQAQS